MELDAEFNCPKMKKGNKVLSLRDSNNCAFSAGKFKMPILAAFSFIRALTNITATEARFRMRDLNVNHRGPQ